VRVEFHGRIQLSRFDRSHTNVTNPYHNSTNLRINEKFRVVVHSLSPKVQSNCGRHIRSESNTALQVH
jgi:hypothetical protein